jgi:ubiquinone/menaquinone biosynthesis C-methylase UbiE
MGELIARPSPDSALEFDGERYTTSFGGQTAIEHWHRYLYARELVRGGDVLDIACGEGYGSALLAQTARSVVGVDLSAMAIEHARHAYRSDNLRYLAGNALAIPLEDASVDVVVSFETIEHFRDHGPFLMEIRRVLRPGGLLVISTPDRDNYSPPGTPANPFHQLELTATEFRALLMPHFARLQILGQRILLGSALLREAGGESPAIVFERRGEDHFEASQGPARAKYLVAVATNSALPALPQSIYVDTDRLLQVDGAMIEQILGGSLTPGAAARVSELEAKVSELLSYIEVRDKILAQLTANLADLNSKIREFEDCIAERERTIAVLTAAKSDSDSKVIKLLSDMVERDRVVARLTGDAADLEAQLAQVTARVEWTIARKDVQRLAAELGAAEAERQWATSELRALQQPAA